MRNLKEKVRKHIEKRGKGFTLVELLAVIVILAVVILIAVTAVIPRMNSAKKNAFADEALAYIKAAKEANVESQMDGEQGLTCFTIEYLNDGYIDKKSEEYEGFISLDNGVWKAYIKNDKYMINGEGGNLSKSNVEDAGELSSAPSTCVGAPLPKICKRATTLHTENCLESSNNCNADGYANGSAITFGNLGTSGTLATGDAFDCDVNGDGTFDAETERFYYVTNMNSDIAVLIYYSNVTAGQPNVSNTSKYNENQMGTTQYKGPEAAIQQLPTTSQWSNINLSNPIRDIKDDKGNVRVSGFSYEGYAARLLSYDDVYAGCYNGTNKLTDNGGLSYKCQFLMETTTYSLSGYGRYVKGLWLENVEDGYAYYAMQIQSSRRNVETYYSDNSTYYGVKPVIEVPIANIEV